MLILRIRQAECALGDGRLDEAFDLVMGNGMREHKRGQDLAGRLSRKLVVRGREHLEGARLVQAGADCEKAAKLAGNLPEIEALRGDVAQTLLSKQMDEKRQADAVAAARREIAAGHLSIGQKMLGEMRDQAGAGAATLIMDVAAKRAVIDNLLAKAAEALRRDDWETAVDELVQAKRTHANDSRVRELVAQTTKTLTKRIESAIAAGRLDTAACVVKRLSRMAEDSLEAEQLARTIEQCRLAWEMIERGQPRRAEEIVRRLAVVLPEADWIESALKNLRAAGDAMDQLRAGPFAMLEQTRGADVVNVQHEVPRAVPAAGAVRGKPVLAMNESLAKKLILQVDGVGSFLVVRGPRVSLGPISASQSVDLPLMADAAAPVVFVERTEEDYFLRSGMAITVNDKATKGKLLRSGDKIAISPRCRMSFRVPSGASTSAVLDLHSARMPRADVRNVVLMDREIIMGAGSSSHVRADEMTSPAVLVARDGNLYCQSKAGVTIDGQVADGNTAIPLGKQVQVGGVSFVVTQA